MFYHLAVGEY